MAGKMCGRCGLVVEPASPHGLRVRCRECGGGLYWTYGLPPELFPPGAHAPVGVAENMNAQETEDYWGFRPFASGGAPMRLTPIKE